MLLLNSSFLICVNISKLASHHSSTLSYQINQLLKNWITHHRIPLLFSAVCLALLLLIVFQVNWLLTSRALVEEQFDQRVSLALGSALTEYNTKYSKDLFLEEFNSCADNKDKACYFFESDVKNAIPKSEQAVLLKTLSGYMSCFGIDEGYDVAIFNNQSYCAEDDAYCCAINPNVIEMADYQLSVSFPRRGDYVFDKLKFMMLSSVLISLLLGLVSFIILRALVQQKRITENNIDFFNNTAHELKTPLANITLALSLFNRKNKEHEGNKYLHIIETENSKLITQIKRVLYLSKMESEEYRLQEEELDLRAIVNKAVGYMEMIINEKKGIIEIDFPANECLVKGDPFHLNNICINLIDNALKYCERKPHLSISIREERCRYKLIFSDNGIGISKNDQAHIFKKFQRVNTGDIRETKGFGIGLSYVKKALELHKAYIEVKSELNKGSQFEISIPIS